MPSLALGATQHAMLKGMATVAYLVPIAGPPAAPFTLAPDSPPLLLGRHDGCALHTPTAEERISRRHARFLNTGAQWTIADLKSTWGTYLNGYRLPPEQPHVLAEGDLIRITPWTFSFRHDLASSVTISTQDDRQQMLTSVRSIPPSQLAPADDPLSLLIEAAAGIHQATDEKTLAELLTETARRATGHGHAAYLRAGDHDGQVQVLALAPAPLLAGPGDDGVYSRSLLQAAASGNLAVLAADAPSAADGQSIVQLAIHSALCAPLLLGQTVAGYLYLDSRQGQPRPRPRAADLCLALARIASLALANLKRIEIERRQATLNAELAQAAAVQKQILPPREQHFGPITVLGESRPGQLLGGDFFDVIPLGGGRLALALGDVCGKGVTASVLMTTIHGFLHATLISGIALDEAVRRLNDFLAPRRSEERFATMFCTILDCSAHTLTYVDAGHGYGMLLDHPSAQATPLQEGGGPPLGFVPNYAYAAHTINLPPDKPGMLLVVSDGIVEQDAAANEHPEEGPQQFGFAGIHAALASTPQGHDQLQHLFAAVESHAGSQCLADDATILLAQWK